MPIILSLELNQTGSFTANVSAAVGPMNAESIKKCCLPTLTREVLDFLALRSTCCRVVLLPALNQFLEDALRTKNGRSLQAALNLLLAYIPLWHPSLPGHFQLLQVLKSILNQGMWSEITGGCSVDDEAALSRRLVAGFETLIGAS